VNHYKIEDEIWDIVIKRFMVKGSFKRGLIKYSNYEQKMNDIYNSIEALAIDVEYDLDKEKK